MGATYTDTIRRWAADDRRAGLLEDADGTGEVGLGAEESGRRLAVRFTLRLNGDFAETVRYQVFGCGFTIAACAAAADLAEGRPLAEITALTPAAVAVALADLPPERDYCAALAVEALRAAAVSARNGRHPVAAAVATDDDHAPLLTPSDPVYRLLLDSPAPRGALPADRHLFACLLAVAAGETADTHAALGLSIDELNDLRQLYFPKIAPEQLSALATPSARPAPRIDADLARLLAEHLPEDDDGWVPAPSLWLARILAARAMHPGHLWRAMGLFARPELTAAIRRHLPALAEANSNGMRWKRFFYRQLCERGGGTMCKAPECGVCSDYALCFGEG